MRCVPREAFVEPGYEEFAYEDGPLPINSGRFADSGGWGYAAFEYDTSIGTFRPATLSDQPPQNNEAKCGAGCHTIVKARDYVFTEYPKR